MEFCFAHVIDIPKSPDLQSQQIQENGLKCARPFPSFWGGVWARDQKIEKGLDFNVDNGRRLFFDNQEAKKVSERRVVR